MTLATRTGQCLLEEDDGVVRWLTINRSKVHNALNASVFDELSGAIDRVSASPMIRCMVITGSGDRAFCAGADLDELHELDLPEAETILDHGGEVLNRLEVMRIPVIAAVNGLALGGGLELALACTLIVASEQAAFALPETGLGLMPGYGGTQRLSRQVGIQAARRIVMGGERVDAATAHRIGLIYDPPSQPETLRRDVQQIAERLATRGPVATAMVLDALRASSEVPLEVGLRLERSLAAMCIVSAEAQEGMTAFRERREPNFGMSGGS